MQRPRPYPAPAPTPVQAAEAGLAPPLESHQPLAAQEPSPACARQPRRCNIMTVITATMLHRRGQVPGPGATNEVEVTGVTQVAGVRPRPQPGPGLSPAPASAPPRPGLRAQPSRSAALRILPDGPLGSSSMNRISRGYLYAASRSRV